MKKLIQKLKNKRKSPSKNQEQSDIELRQFALNQAVYYYKNCHALKSGSILEEAEQFYNFIKTGIFLSTEGKEDQKLRDRSDLMLKTLKEMQKARDTKLELEAYIETLREHHDILRKRS